MTQLEAATIKQRAAEAEQGCNVKFPPGTASTAVARARCLNDAQTITRPYWTQPDLIGSFMATRLAIAERFQKGQITAAQANEEVANKWSQITTETQRRSLANRSVAAQEDAAIAAASLADGVGRTVQSSSTPPPAPSYAPPPGGWQPSSNTASCAEGYRCAGRTQQADGTWR